MSEIAQAYVQVIPTTKGISKSLESELGGAGSSAGERTGSNFIGGLKKAFVALGIGKVIQEALNEGAALQQSIGGINTLYGTGSVQLQKYGESIQDLKQYTEDTAAATKAQSMMMEYANNAYKTAGLSANEYMETATGFAAALKSSLGGDVVAAANAADIAITDMADNSNKMGTSMESIQNAYAGFAKQNYTMLDNLKLGYGGTQAEMERLLADAQAISGVKYDINNLSDVYSAIHVIQGELGITGATADEAASTFSGSMASMKAAVTNLLGNLTLGQDIGPSLLALQETVFTFLTNNLVPMLGNLVQNIPTLLSGAIQMAMEGISLLVENAPEILNMIVSVIGQTAMVIVEQLPTLAQSILDGVMTLLPTLLEVGLNIITGICEGLTTNLPTLVQGATQMVLGLVQQLPTVITSLISALPGIINTVTSTLVSLIPELVSCAVELIHGIVQAIPTIISALIDAMPEIVSSVIEALIQCIPMLIQCTLDLIIAVVEELPTLIIEIIKIIPELVQAMAEGFFNEWPQIKESFGNIIDQVASALPQLWETLKSAAIELVTGLAETYKTYGTEFLNAAKELILKMWEGIKEKWEDLKTNAVNLVENLPQILTEALSDIFSVGSNLVSGLWEGISDGWNWLTSKVQSLASSLLDAAKSALGIHSPSTKMEWVGEMYNKGLASGLEKTGLVSDALDDIEDMALNLNLGYSVGGPAANVGANMNIVINVYPREGQDEETIADYVLEKLNFEYERAERQMA